MMAGEPSQAVDNATFQEQMALLRADLQAAANQHDARQRELIAHMCIALELVAAATMTVDGSKDVQALSAVLHERIHIYEGMFRDLATHHYEQLRP